MEHYIVTRANGTTYQLQREGAAITQAQQKRVLMGEDVVTMTVESVGYIDFKIGDWITVFGDRYTLNTLGQPERIGDNMFRYDLKWEGVKYDLTKVMFRNADALGFNPSGDFSLTGKAVNFMEVLQYNLNRAFGTGVWAIGDVPDTDAKTLTFSNENCLNVLNTLCNEFETEYEIAYTAGVNVVHIRTAGSASLLSFEYGKGKGLYSLTRRNVDSKNIITRLYAEGSNKNIKAGYRDNALRLRMSVNDESYIDSDNIADYGTIEGSVMFDDVYPHRTGTITALGADIFTFVDSGMPFDLNEKDTQGQTKWLIAGTTAKMHFNTGNLAGYQFEIISYNHATNTFKLKQYEDERGLKIPNPDSSAFQLGVNDEYVLLDIIMPDIYVQAAEAELLAKAHDYLAQNCQPRVEYALNLDPFYLKVTFGTGGTVPNVFAVGDYINVKDTKIGVDKAVRVKDFTRKLADPYEYSVSLSDVVEPTRIERLIAATVESEKAVRLNNLMDPARARRNWRDAEELAGMVETLRAEVALIGSPEGQFQTDIYFIPNYNGDPNVFKTTLGLLVHSAYPADTPGTWGIAAYEGSLTAEQAYYVYAKCAKADQSGMIALSTTKIGVEDDLNYYHFPLGVLSSVSDNARTFTSTYGYTLISGNNITTGIIQNGESGLTINLQTGEIRGAFKFLDGTDVQSSVKAKTERHIGGTDPQAMWETVSEKRLHVNNEWMKLVDGGTESYIYVETTPDNFEWVLDETIIDGGRIKTGVIEAERIDSKGLFAQQITATDLNVAYGHVGGFTIDNVLRSEDEQGRGIIIDPTNFKVSIEGKSEGTGISAVHLRAGELTPYLELTKGSGSISGTTVNSAALAFSYTSVQLRTSGGQNKTQYLGKLNATTGLASASVPANANKFALSSDKNYAADLRYLFAIQHNGGSHDGKTHKIHGALAVAVTTTLVGVNASGVEKVLAAAQTSFINIERSSNLLYDEYPLTRKTSFNSQDCIYAYWRLDLNLSGDLTYQQWNKSVWGSWWSTETGWSIQFQTKIGALTSFYPSVGVTELTTSGFQTVWATNRYFRIDGNDADTFIRSAGVWRHNGVLIATIDDVNSAIPDLAPYVLISDLQAAYETKAVAEGKYMRKTGGNTITGNQTITGDLTITGNLTQVGASYITHAERVYTSNDFIVMRDGATGALGSGALSGLRISKADGNVNLVLGAGNDAIARVGWEGGTMQALATREDNPTNGGIAFWDSALNLFKSVNPATVTVGYATYAYTAGNSVMLGGYTDLNFYRKYATKAAGEFYTGTTNPTNTDRLNFDGYLYATRLYSGAIQVATLTGAETLTNKTLTSPTLTSPRFASAGYIADANGNELIKFSATVASAVNEITVTNSVSTVAPSISASGNDTNIDLNLYAKGTGLVKAMSSFSVYKATGNEATSQIQSGTAYTRFFFRDTDNHFGLYISDATKAITRLRIKGSTGDIYINEANDGFVGINLPHSTALSNSLTIGGSAGLIGSASFASGFAGNGWRVEQEGSGVRLTVDNLTVRKGMDVYELRINQIRGTNGALWVSDAAKVASVVYGLLTIDTGGSSNMVPFAVDDIIKCQRWTGNTVKYYKAQVTAVSSNTITVSKLEGSDSNPFPYAAGDEIVRVNNATDTNRMGAIYLTASDSNAPNIDVIYNEAIKVRMGKLNGITDSTYGALTGYGLYADNVYLKGKIVASGGTIAGWDINESRLRSANQRIHLSNAYNRIVLTKAATDTPTSGSRISMYYNNDSSWGLWGSLDGTNPVFEIGSANKIAGWEFDINRLWTGNSGSQGNTSIQISNVNSGSGNVYSNMQILKGFSYTWHQNNNAGHIVMGQVAASANTLKSGFFGIQMMNHASQEFFCLSANVAVSGSQEYYNRIAGWGFDNQKLYSGNIELSSTGKIWHKGGKWAFNSDGSGLLANGKISWDTVGNMTIDGALIGNTIKSSNWSDTQGTSINLQTGEILLGGSDRITFNAIASDGKLIKVKNSLDNSTGIYIGDFDLTSIAALSGSSLSGTGSGSYSRTVLAAQDEELNDPTTTVVLGSAEAYMGRAYATGSNFYVNDNTATYTALSANTPVEFKCNINLSVAGGGLSVSVNSLENMFNIYGVYANKTGCNAYVTMWVLDSSENVITSKTISYNLSVSSGSGSSISTTKEFLVNFTIPSNGQFKIKFQYSGSFFSNVVSQVNSSTWNVMKYNINTTLSAPGAFSILPKAGYTEMAPKGFQVIRDVNNYFKIDNQATGSTNFLTVKGATDMPGILASGSVSSTLVHSNKWGAKVGNTVTRPSTGVYVVPHGLNRTDFTVVATGTADSVRCHVTGKTSSTFTITCREYSNNSLINSSFDYIMVGNN